MNRLRKNLRALAEDVSRPDSQFKAGLPNAAIADRRFSLMASHQVLFVCERTSDRGCRLPDPKVGEIGTYYTEIADALSPLWLQRAMQAAADRAQLDGLQCGSASQT